ncbi:MAG TPA: MATE family efflux transporter [Myxococcota bacterium]|nr:MATE family efflux transporter [Myxococcota bacterium]
MATPIAASAASHAPARSGGVREVAWLAYPIVLTQMSQTVMNVVDSIFVGHLGAAPLGALGFAGIWLWTVMSFFSGTATGVQTFVSQAHGAGDEAACGPWAWQGLYAVVPALALATLGFVALADPLWRVMGTTDELRSYALSYARMRPLGVAGLGVWMVLASFFRGLGDTRTPLIATLVANAANALLAWALVFGHLGLPAWGVAGAGLATSTAEWIGVLVLAVGLLRPSVAQRYATQPVRPSAPEIRRFLRTGAPIGGQWILDMSAFAIFTTLVARMGNASMAANQAMISLLSISFMQAIGIGLAATTLVGRYKGAGDLAAAVRSVRSAVGLAIALAVVVAAVFVLAPEALLGMYIDDPEVLRLGRPLLALGAAFQLFDALQIVTGGALRGAGDTRWPFLVQTGLAWVVRLPFAYLFAIVLGRGVVGAWYAEFLFILALAVALGWRFRNGAWKEVRI